MAFEGATVAGDSPNVSERSAAVLASLSGGESDWAAAAGLVADVGCSTGAAGVAGGLGFSTAAASVMTGLGSSAAAGVIRGSGRSSPGDSPAEGDGCATLFCELPQAITEREITPTRVAQDHDVLRCFMGYATRR